MSAFDSGLHRHRNDNEIDSTRSELVAKIDDCFYRIRLDGGRVLSARHGFWFEERRAGHAINGWSIEEPAVTAWVNLFVAGAEFHERELNSRQQPFRNN